MVSGLEFVHKWIAGHVVSYVALSFNVIDLESVRELSKRPALNAAFRLGLLAAE